MKFILDKMNTLFFIQCLICFASLKLFSQTGSQSAVSVLMLKGTVLGAGNNPIAGASLKLIKENQTINTVSSDALGKYILQVPISAVNPKNEYHVIISKKGKITNKVIVNSFISQEEIKKHSSAQYEFDLVIVMPDENPNQIVKEFPGGKLNWNLEKHVFSLQQIYARVSVKKDKISKSSLIGKILINNLNNSETSAIRISLLSSEGAVLQSVISDSSVFFEFKNLDVDKFYVIKVESDDPNITNQKKIYLSDRMGRIVCASRKNKNSFLFENLPPDINLLPTLYDEDKNFSITGSFLSGEAKRPMTNTMVVLKNEDGKVIQSTVTNNVGSFVFLNLSSSLNFTIAAEPFDQKLLSDILALISKNGKIVYSSMGGVFQFTVLAADKNTLLVLIVEDSNLFANLKGKLMSDKNGKNPIAKAKISLVAADGKTAVSSVTDSFGNFSFDSLPADNKFYVKLNEGDPAHAFKDVFIADTNKIVLGTLKSSKEIFFRYDIHPIEEPASLANIYFNDPWKEVETLKTGSSITIVEHIFYEYSKWDIVSEAGNVLDKVAETLKRNPNVVIELVSHTDSRGSDEFNMQLSQKRASSAVDYIVSKGINKKRITGAGMGESKIVNRCKNGIDCTEEEHKENRRTEFVVKKIK